MKFIIKIFSFLLLIQTILLILGYDVYGARKILEPSLKNIIVSGLLTCFTFGIYKWLDKKSDKEYFKCPKCEKVYGASEVQDNICSKCNVEVIDLDTYYK